jgi:hypothetical protein
VSGEGLKASMITSAEDTRAITAFHRMDGLDGRGSTARQGVLVHE